MKSAIIPKSDSRLIVIGDIHGCSDVLDRLLNVIAPQQDDTFIFLGDLIDRGFDSKGVIDRVISLSELCKVYCILGNHEEMMLGAYYGGKSDIKYWCQFGGLEALISFEVDNVKDIPLRYIAFLGTFYDYLENDEYIFVHAGCDSSISLNANSIDNLRWTRPHMSPHISGKTVVCGHMHYKEILNLGHYLCIDTGCGIKEEGLLSAVDLKSKTIWQYGSHRKRVGIKSL